MTLASYGFAVGGAGPIGLTPANDLGCRARTRLIGKDPSIKEWPQVLFRPERHVHWRGGQLPEDVMELALVATGPRRFLRPATPGHAATPVVAR